MHDVGLKGHGGLLGSGMSVPRREVKSGGVAY